MSKELNVFNSMQNRSVKTRKWLFFPFSLLFHGVLIAAVIIVPLMNADSTYPAVKITEVFMTAPPPPPTPTPPGGKKSTGKKVNKIKKKKKQRKKTVKQVYFRIPVTIPEEIPEEDVLEGMEGIEDGLVDGGVEIGVEGSPGIGDILGNDSSPKTQTIQLSIVEQPRLIRRVDPQYPKIARDAYVKGLVIVEAVTDIYGRVETVTVLRGHPLLRSAAIQAIKQWVYEPYIFNGIPKPVKFTVSITFQFK